MGGPSSSGTVNNLSPELGALIGDYLNNTSPALKGLSSELGGLFGPAYAGATSAANSLENFNALQPADIAALSSASGAAVESAGRTAEATSGGTPNPALQNKNLSISAGQETGRTATQLGEVAATQNLGAKTAGANALAGLSSESLQGILSALGIQAGALNTGVQGQLGVANQQEQNQNAKNNTIGSSFGSLAELGALFA